MSIDKYTDPSELQWENDTPYNPLKGHHDILDASEKHVGIEKNIIKLNENKMSEEFKIALQAWDALYNSEGSFNPKLGHIDNIEKWIEKYHPCLPDAGKKRIAKVINLNKKGGATAINKI